jgi:hypothetical protein
LSYKNTVSKADTMSKQPVEFPSISNADPDEEALSLVLRLARARGRVVHDDAALDASEKTDAADRIETDIREIERASAALKRVQPDLEAWRSKPLDSTPVRKPSSAWVVIGVVWFSTVLALSIATVAIAVLVS